MKRIFFTGFLITMTVAIFAQADLAVSLATASPTTVTAGSSFNVGSTVVNQGDSTAATSQLAYLLSTDTIWDSNDTYLNYNQIDSIQSSGTKTASSTITIPSITGGGSYYLIFVTDYNNDIAESDETNNIYALPFNVIPLQANLTRQTNSGTLNVNGTTVNINTTIINTGAVNADSSVIGYYLSPDVNFTTADYLIGSQTIASLAVNGSANRNLNVDINNDTIIPMGTYYIGYIIDYQDSILESNEYDNTFYFTNAQVIKTTPGNGNLPDLVVENTVINTLSIPQGSTVTVNSKVKNQGVTSANPSIMGYYLSSDTIWDASTDIYLAQDQVSTLSIGAKDSETGNLTIPTTVTNGNYYILFVADYQMTINEGDETNNVSYEPIIVNSATPNLTYQVNSNALTVNNSVVSISVIVKNIGGGSASNFHVGYYLSSNTNITTNDYLIGTDVVNSLSAGGTNTESITVDISNLGTVPTGTYYIGFIVDHADVVIESDESDNKHYWASTQVSKVSGTASDLIVNSTTTSLSSVSAGSNVAVTASVKNIGAGASGASYLGYYLSSNTSWDASDVYLGQDQVSALAINATDAETANLTIPSNTNNGNYYILFVADYLLGVTESDEMNNVNYRSIVVGSGSGGGGGGGGTGSSPNLLAQAPSLTVSGTTVSLNMVVKNNGTGSAGTSYVGYYLSDNANITTNDHLIGTDYVTSLSAGGTSVESIVVDIATLNGIPSGTYYVGYIIDYQNDVAESNEVDNTDYWQNNQVTQFANASPDLVVQGMSTSLPALGQGDDLTLNVTIKNQGAGSAGVSFTGYYLSTNQTLEPSTDIYLDNEQISLLSSNSTASSAITLTMPTNITDGAYYLLAVADYLSIVNESDETNNVGVQAINIDVNASIPPFSWTPTNQSGIFLGQAYVDSVVTEFGDWIAAFGPNGECAGAAPILINADTGYINLPIYGDDANTVLDEGISAGEYFTLKLYDASAGVYRDYPTVSTKYQFTQWSNTNGSVMPAYNSIDSVYNFVERVSDEIILTSGWNLISFDLVADDSSIVNIFSEIIDSSNLIYVTAFNNGSTFFDPNGPAFLNTLTDVERGYGYWVKVGVDDTLIIDGLPLANDFKVDLNAGWNLTAYIPYAPTTPQDFYQTLIDSSSLLFATGFDNGSTFFDPNGQSFFNTLDTLENGFGYWVNVSSSVSSNAYRGGGFKPTNVYDFMNGTSNLTDNAYVGQLVNVYDSKGELCGELEIVQGGYLMTTSLYGDDLLTPEKDGITVGEQLIFEFQGVIIDLGTVFTGTMMLHQIDLQFDMSQLTNTETVQENTTQLLAYPNPFTNELTIQYELVSTASMVLKIYNATGTLVEIQDLGILSAGEQRAFWSAQNQSTGLYIITLEADGQIIGSEKVIKK